MTNAHLRFGFRIVGGVATRRRLVEAGVALAAYTACHPRAEVDREAYLSAFWFGADFRSYLEQTGSPKGYNGVCWAPFVWFDLDAADDPQRALSETRSLAGAILDRYRQLDENDLLLFFSGSKGFHVGLPTFWKPAPSLDFHHVARRFAEQIAALVRVTIDSGVYDKVRAFRAPNSRHPKTGLRKRRLSHEELMGLSIEGIRRLAESPEPFGLPVPSATCEQAAADWQAAMTAVVQQAQEKAWRRAAVADGAPTLNRRTLDFIRDGADNGDRHRLLFSAAANLAEFGCPPALAYSLLTEAALDSGLSPSDVRRQIDCGLQQGRQPKGGPADG
jgi:hypothetical protein